MATARRTTCLDRNAGTHSAHAAETPEQIRGSTLGRPHRGQVPLGGVTIRRGHERRLPAHRQPNVLPGEVLVDRPAQFDNGLPLRVGVGFVDARRFVHPPNRHLVMKFDLAFADASGDGRGARWIGRAGERQMAFTGEQARRGIEANPTGPWQIGFAPRVQIGEIAIGSGRAVDRLDVGGELD